MKRKYLVVLFVFIATCKSKNETTKAVISKSPKSDYYPYAARYTAGFDPGNPAYLEKVLNFWKEYETGDIRKTARLFTDTITLIFPDQVLHGQRDAMLAQYKKMRDVYSVVQSHVDSWMPAITKSHGDDVVFIWGFQERTTKNGKLYTPDVHEVWRFTKEGKIKFMQQYVSLYNNYR